MFGACAIFPDDFSDWVLSLPETPLERMAWAVRSDGAPYYLFRKTWINPEPGKEIATLDFLGGLGNGEPFLIGITAE